MLKVIGAGLGRTGTKSLQIALEMLGFGPCHHMTEVVEHPETRAQWIAAGQGKADWHAIYKDYQSTVDYPGAVYWRELAAAFPDAKILLTVRDAEKWFESTQSTIFKPDGPLPRGVAGGDGQWAQFFRSFTQPIAGHLHDRDFLMAHFHAHNAAVKAAIAPERLLVYEAGQGWEPLCRFLQVAVPDQPYPSENSRADFAKYKPSRG